jgi:beta-mannanase
MNGSWFPYGQDPIKFIASWKRVVDYVRKALGESNRSNFAFIWGPNSGNGYPYVLPPPDGFSPDASTTEGKARIAALDTNGNGELDRLDDPYQPYYPGDDYVDWVGISIYHCK